MSKADATGKRVLDALARQTIQDMRPAPNGIVVATNCGARAFVRAARIKENAMKVATMGTGRLGGALARLWARAGHEVMISSRHPDRLAEGAHSLGTTGRYGTVEEASAFGDVLLLAIPFGGINELCRRMGSKADGKVVLDAMNPFPDRDGAIATIEARYGLASGEATQARLSRSRVVRAFSTIPATEIESVAHRHPVAVAVPYAGDDAEAKKIAARLIRDAGFEPLDLGTLIQSKPLDPGGPLFGKVLSADDARQVLELVTHV
jgi:8-hydroxy-5-deazaflavin:NADPH oxidoreductase